MADEDVELVRDEASAAMDKSLRGLRADLGLDFIGPLSPAYNDQAAFYGEHGGRLAVFGGLDNTPIIESASPAEIAAAVAAPRESLPDGLILHTHELPSGTPPENIDAAVRALAGA